MYLAPISATEQSATSISSPQTTSSSVTIPITSSSNIISFTDSLSSLPQNLSYTSFQMTSSSDTRSISEISTSSSFGMASSSSPGGSRTSAASGAVIGGVVILVIAIIIVITVVVVLLLLYLNLSKKKFKPLEHQESKSLDNIIYNNRKRKSISR